MSEGCLAEGRVLLVSTKFLNLLASAFSRSRFPLPLERSSASGRSSTLGEFGLPAKDCRLSIGSSSNDSALSDSPVRIALFDQTIPAEAQPRPTRNRRSRSAAAISTEGEPGRASAIRSGNLASCLLQVLSELCGLTLKPDIRLCRSRAFLDLGLKIGSLVHQLKDLLGGDRLVKTQRGNDGNPFAARGRRYRRVRCGPELTRCRLPLQLAFGLDDRASPVLDFRGLPELMSARSRSVARVRYGSNGARPRAWSCWISCTQWAGILPLQVFLLAASVSNLHGLLDEVGPELDPASHWRRRKRLTGRLSQMADDSPWSPSLRRPFLLLGRRKFEPVPGLVQARLSRCLLRDTLDLAA